SLGAVHVEAADQLCRGQESARLSMPGGVTVFREAGRLLICPEKLFRTKGRLPEEDFYPVSRDAYSWRILDFDGDLAAIPRNKYTKWFDYDKMAVFPDFRTRQAGDYMKLSSGAGKPELMTRKVARVMLDAGVPSRFRDRILFPCRGKEALWIPGIRMGDSCRITPDTKRILEIT
ncbi:MAG TPA: hypothetical protein DCP64_06120, partial [Sarcina sp.]|nr:hypothetical protein [Sarcina sp.]